MTDNSQGNPENKRLTCKSCRREIYMGKEAISLERVVIGSRGPIPLESVILLHPDKCLEEYVCNGASEQVPKRIP